MAIENERKYLLAHGHDMSSALAELNSITANPNGTNGLIVRTEIHQGYIIIDESVDRHLRVRVEYGERHHKNGTPTLTYKDGKGERRLEYEWKIPLWQANEHLANTKLEFWKTRRKIYLTHSDPSYGHARYELVIDEYDDGLITIEVEWWDSRNWPVLPDFVGLEVTDVDKYSNIAIARRLLYTQ